MCMPLASIGEPSSGKSQTFVMELIPNADYTMVSNTDEISAHSHKKGAM